MSVTVNTYTRRMPRSSAETRERLTKAALELYAEQGYAQTTAAEIAKKAGTTERTFFRHFADKSEVILGRHSPLQEKMLEALAQMPAELGPLDAVVSSVQAAGKHFFQEETRAFYRQRQQLIESDTELSSRELHKLAGLSSALAAALQQRGVPGLKARLAAQAGLIVLGETYTQWLGEAEKDWQTCALNHLMALRQVVTAG